MDIYNKYINKNKMEVLFGIILGIFGVFMYNKIKGFSKSKGTSHTGGGTSGGGNGDEEDDTVEKSF